MISKVSKLVSNSNSPSEISSSKWFVYSVLFRNLLILLVHQQKRHLSKAGKKRMRSTDRHQHSQKSTTGGKIKTVAWPQSYGVFSFDCKISEPKFILKDQKQERKG